MSGLAGLIVAGGRARRLGQPKGLIPVGDQPLLAVLVEQFRRARLAPIVVVATGETLTLAQTLEGVVAVASDPEAEMVDSVARGLAHVPGDRDGAVVQPVDAPFTTAEMIVRLGSGERPRILCHRAVPGHPVMLPARFFPRVAARPEGGLRGLLAESEVELVEWTDARVLADLDTPADLEAWGLVRH